MERKTLYISLFEQLVRLERLHFQYMHAKLEQLGMYPGQPQLLTAIARNENASQKELAQTMHIRPATLTVMLKRMGAKGLVDRRSDAHDQRIVRLSLTPKGKQKVKALEDVVGGVGDEFFDGISLDRIKQTKELLSYLSEQFARAVPGGEQEEAIIFDKEE